MSLDSRLLLCLALIVSCCCLASSTESSDAENDEIGKLIAQVNPKVLFYDLNKLYCTALNLLNDRKVELHLHLEGTVRHATAYELLKYI